MAASGIAFAGQVQAGEGLSERPERGRAADALDRPGRPLPYDLPFRRRRVARRSSRISATAFIRSAWWMRSPA